MCTLQILKELVLYDIFQTNFPENKFKKKYIGFFFLQRYTFKPVISANWQRIWKHKLRLVLKFQQNISKC